MVGNLKIGDQFRKTPIRFRNIDDYEPYINAVHQDFESQDAIFNGYIYEKYTPHFNKVNKVKMQMVVFLNTKLLNNEVEIVLYQLMVIVLTNVQII